MNDLRRQMNFTAKLTKKFVHLISAAKFLISLILCVLKNPSVCKRSVKPVKANTGLPIETLLEILRFFNRKALAKLQPTNRKLNSIVYTHFGTYPLLTLKASIKYERGNFSIWKQKPNARNSMWISIENSIYLNNNFRLDYATLVSSKFLRFSTNIFFFSNSFDKNAEAFVKYAYPLRHLWASMIVKVNADFTVCRSEFLYSKIFSSGVFAACFGIYVNNLSYKSQIGPGFTIGDRSLLNLADILNTQLVYITNKNRNNVRCNESIVDWLFEKLEGKQSFPTTNWPRNERILILHCNTLNSEISWILNKIKKKFLNDVMPCTFHFIQVHNNNCITGIASTRLKNGITGELLISWVGEGVDCDGNKYNTTVISRCPKQYSLDTKMSRPFLFHPFS